MTTFPLPMQIQPAIAGLIICLLLVAAGCDLAVRRIPNWLCLAVAGLGLLARLGEGRAAVLAGLGGGALVFALLVLAWRRGWLGGGDVKLMSALALGLAPLDCLRCLEAITLAGGVLALAYLAAGRLLPPWRPRARNRLLRLAALEIRRIRRGNSLPYGLAIAAGGLFILLPR